MFSNDVFDDVTGSSVDGVAEGDDDASVQYQHHNSWHNIQTTSLNKC